MEILGVNSFSILRVILKKKKSEALDSTVSQGFYKNQGDAIITVDREIPSLCQANPPPPSPNQLSSL